MHYLNLFPDKNYAEDEMLTYETFTFSLSKFFFKKRFNVEQKKNRFSPVEYLKGCRGRDLNPRPPDFLALASKRTFELSL